MYVILPLYGLSIPADEENALFSFQEPKNRGTLRPSKATKPFLPEKQCKYALSWCISALAWTFGIRKKSEQALSLLAVCGSLNADSVLAPKGGKNYLSHWLSR
jgi:hypothetical protein